MTALMPCSIELETTARILSYTHQDCFLAESTARCFLSNVAALLCQDGLFFGLVPDSSTMWYVALPGYLKDQPGI